MRCYVVNLARSVERRAHMLAELRRSGLDYRFVDAVDGRELDLNDRRLVGASLAEVVTSRTGGSVAGVLGCALSHLRAYEQILEDRLPHALVLEDDVLLPADIRQVSEAVAGAVSGAAVALLNFACHDLVRVHREGAVALSGGRLLAYPAYGCELTSSAAYVITSEACKRMRAGAVPVETYPDDWALFQRAGMLGTLQCVVPMPVALSTQFRSTIDYYEPGTLQARVREWVGRSQVPVVSHLLAYRRKRSFQRRGWLPSVEFVDGKGAGSEQEGPGQRPRGGDR